jgi:phage tail-like protein
MASESTSESAVKPGLKGGANGFAELLTASRFYLELKLDGGDDTIDATFLECKGFQRSHDIVEFCEVTPEKWAKANTGRVVRIQLPGNTKTEHIVLRRGMTTSMTLWKWFDAVESGKWASQCRDGSLTIYDQGGQEQARFNFEGAWPLRYQVADVNASSNDLEIEELEMAIDRFVRVEPEQAP